MKHFGSALTAIRRSPYQTMAAVLLVALTFFVAYVFTFFLYGAEQVLRYFETRPQITAFFKLDTDTNTIQSIATSMKEKPYVSGVSLISKDQALEIYRQDNEKDPLLLELVTADILPASIEVSSKEVGNLSDIEKDLEKFPGVEEVVYQKDVVNTLQSWTNSVRNIGFAAILLLSATSILLIIVVTGMKVVTRRKAIQIMRILGASRWYVNAPFIYEGVLYGIVGSLFGWGAAYVGLLYVTPWLQGFLGSVPLLPLPTEFLVIQLSLGTAVGIIFGALASAFATLRMMRRS